MMVDAVAFVAITAFVFAAASVAAPPVTVAGTLGGCSPRKNLDFSATRAKIEPGFIT